MKTYINYDLHVTRQGKHYDLRVNCPVAGQATSQALSSFLDSAILNEWEEFEPKEIGQYLYNAIFQDSIEIHLHKSLTAANAEDRGLRIRLHLNESPELANLPWEYLYDVARDEFLALSINTPIVRYLDLPIPEPDMNLKGTVHILVIIACPTDLQSHIDADREWQQFQAAFQELEAAHKVKIHRLHRATRVDLQRYLRQHKIHILHFIGHGQYNRNNEEGGLIFENSKGQAEFVSATLLAHLLKDHRLRLVYLNSCDTAQASLLDPLSGVAQALVRHGAPAVVAMQTAIHDEKAIQIAHEFYLALIEGYPVDAALVEGRKAIFSTTGFAEWGTPVLFMRTPDGILWNADSSKEEIEKNQERLGAMQRQNPKNTSDVEVTLGTISGFTGSLAIGNNNTQINHRREGL